MFTRYFHIVLVIICGLEVIANGLTTSSIEFVTIQELFYSFQYLFVVLLAFSFIRGVKIVKWTAGVLFLLQIALLFPYSEQKSPSNENGTEITIFSLNVGQFRNDTSSVNQVIELIKKQQPDIVCLQEFGLYYKWPNTQSVIEDFRKRTGFRYAHFQPKRDDIFGVATLSNLPMMRAKQVFASTKNTNQGYSYTLVVGDKKVQLVNVHLESFNLKNGLGIGAMSSVIEHQRKQLAAVSEETKIPTIIIGDFNNHIGSNTLRFLDSCSLRLVKGSFLEHLWPTQLPFLQNIDHAFVSPKVQYSDINVLYNAPSDHAAILVKLKI